MFCASVFFATYIYIYCEVIKAIYKGRIGGSRWSWTLRGREVSHKLTPGQKEDKSCLKPKPIIDFFFFFSFFFYLNLIAFDEKVEFWLNPAHIPTLLIPCHKQNMTLRRGWFSLNHLSEWTPNEVILVWITLIDKSQLHLTPGAHVRPFQNWASDLKTQGNCNSLIDHLELVISDWPWGGQTLNYRQRNKTKIHIGFKGKTIKPTWRWRAEALKRKSGR